MDDVNSRGAAQGYPLNMDWTDSEEQTWKETEERAEPLDKEGNVSRSLGHVTDFSKDELEKAPPLQPHTLREFEQHLNDLKKENFSLKLRIYFLEERIQQKFEDSSDDVYRTNIELKVEVESLKQELQERQQLLDKALSTAENLTTNNEAEVQRRFDERQQEINHMQEVLETRIQLLQEQAQLARNEAERMATRSQSSCVTMETGSSETAEEESLQLVSTLPDRDKDRVIEELRQALCSKERVIMELTGEKKVLGERVGQLEEQVQELNSSLQQKERDAEFYQEELGRERLRIQQEMQSLIEEQQTQLNQYECAAGQCVSELQKAQLQVQSLQAKIHESEANNKKLQEKLSEMECELRSIRQAAHSQERTIQGLSETISTKDSEAQELYQLIEGQNATLCKLREMAHRNQLQQTQAPEGGGGAGGVAQLQAELVGLQGSLFTVQLELEASQRAQRQSQRQADDQSRTAQRLHSDLQEALQHREATEKHNQDLRVALQQTRSELQEKEVQLRDTEAQGHTELQERDKINAQLRLSLRDKDRLLQEYSELLEPPAEASRPRDVMLDKLRSRIKERDKALERSIDEKFRCLEEKEEEVRRLHQAVREKERDLERLRTILANNEETITSLDALVRGKELEVEHVRESSRKLQSLRQESEEKHALSLRERDNLINQLQTALHTHSKETEELRATLLAKVSVSPAEAVEELKARLQLKERLLQELLSDRSRQAQEHQTQVQDLLSTISARDQYIQDSADRLGQVIGEQTGQVQELRQQLLLRGRELAELSRERERERERADPVARELERVQHLLKEKETFIQELMQGQEEPMDSGGSVSRSSEEQQENRALREELQLALRKLKENQLELTTLRSALASKQELNTGSQDPSGASHQSILEQLVSDYDRLNEALRAEKKLYQNLVQMQSSKDSAERLRVLHTELDTIQALRGQLEEVLMRTRETALVLEKANKTQADFGGGDGQSVGRLRGSPGADGTNAKESVLHENVL